MIELTVTLYFTKWDHFLKKSKYRVGHFKLVKISFFLQISRENIELTNYQFSPVVTISVEFILSKSVRILKSKVSRKKRSFKLSAQSFVRASGASELGRIK